MGAFQFRTAESFLNSLNKKASDRQVDITKYKEGQRIYHKKFGEGTINKIEQEGEDYKLDIQFDKVDTDGVRSAVSEEYGVDENRITIRRDNTDHMQEGL